MTTLELDGQRYRLIEDSELPTNARVKGAFTVACLCGGAAFLWTALDEPLSAAAYIGARVLSLTTMILVPTTPIVGALMDRYSRPAQPMSQGAPPLPVKRLLPDVEVRKRGDPRPLPNDGRRRMRRQTERLTAKAPKQSFNQVTQVVNARRSDWDVAEFYTVLMDIWPTPTQAQFRQAYGSKKGRDWYTVYVGKPKSNETPWGDVGIWRQWQILRQVDGRGKCGWAPWVQQPEDIFRLNRRLCAYARQRGWDV